MSIKSQIEIERKYLLANVPRDLAKLSSEKIIITQFFVDNVKYRMSTYTVKGERFCEKIIKTHVGGITNFEDTEIISYEEYEKAFSEAGKIPIIKLRYEILWGGLKFEVDVFSNIKLIICEVELTDPKYRVNLPEIISNEVIKEVSEDPFFSNRNLFQILNRNN